MKKSVPLFLAVIFVFFSSSLSAQVSLSVSKKASSKIKMAVAPFDLASGIDAALASELKTALSTDLNVSGYFSLISSSEVQGLTQQKMLKWKQTGAEFLILTQIALTGDRIKLECQVFNLNESALVFSKKFEKEKRDRFRLMHEVSDAIVQELFGKPGLGSSRIAFVSNQSGSKQIHLIDWDGRNLIQLTKGANISIYPKWSPVAAQILCTDYSNRLPHIFVLDLTRQTKRPVSTRPGLNAFARYSPDGKKVVLTLSQDGNPEIYTCLSDGTQLRRLTKTKSVESSPCWTPDGKKVVFVSDQSGSPQIYWMNADGTGQERLTLRGRYNTSPEVSPDGKLIAYCSMEGGRFQLFVLDPKTKESVQVTRDPNSNEDPAWGPDSRHLAYTATQNYQSDVYLIDIYDGHPIRLTKGLKDCSSPSWSPAYSSTN